MELINFILINKEFFSFTLILTIFLIIKKKNLTLQGKFPILYILMYKTKWGLKYMKQFHKKNKLTTKIFNKISYTLGIFGSIFVFLFLFYQLYYILKIQPTQGAAFILPIKTQSSAVFYTPFIYWIISLFTLALVHEMAHGIIAQMHNISIKSSGFAFMGIIIPILPAAFVEPNEKQLEKAKPKHQISILGAGPASNVIFGIIFFLLLITLTYTTQNAFEQELHINSITQKSSLNNYNIPIQNISNLKITKINNLTQTSQIYQFINKNLSLNQTYQMQLEYLTQNKEKIKKTVEFQPYSSQNNKTRIGISLSITNKLKNSYTNLLGYTLQFILKLLNYLWFFNIAIGLTNLLPLWITDGGQIFRILLTQKFGKSKGLKYFNYISLLTLTIIIISFNPKFFLGFLI